MMYSRLLPVLLSLCIVHPASAAKCMLVMSYQQGYAWNDGVQKGVESILAGKCKLKIFYMDAKHNKTPEHARAMAKAAKKLIDEYKPDILIASDDYASRYLVSKYYKNTGLPVVFCGVNWNVSKYGYPYKNVTGMIEVAPIQPLIEVSKKISGEIKNVVYLGADTFSEHKNAQRVVNVLHRQGIAVKVSLVSRTDDWKKTFINSQMADVIILGSNAGIAGWHNKEMAGFVRAQAKKMIVTNHSWMAPFSMYSMTKIPEEQGEWAAEAAMAIVRGLSPAKIPIRVNRKWQTYINSPLLKKIGIILNKKDFKNYIEVGGRSQLD